MTEIEQRIAELDNGQPQCFDPASGSEQFWHEGVGAFFKDLLIEQCPYPAGAARDNWLRGWMAAETVGFNEVAWPNRL